VPTTLLHLSPDAALVLLTLGVLLIYVEFNRPGSILPGALGLIAVLTAAAVFSKSHLAIPAIVFLLLAAWCFFRSTRRNTPPVIYVLATILLIVGFLKLIPNTDVPHIHPGTAIPCALVLGISTTYLTRIARRARVNKGLD
jgi:membrane-bound serine protease (ClpP class)